MKKSYPISYFSAIWTPKKVFNERKGMNYFQIILTFLFLNALLLMPIALKGSNQQAFQFDEMLPTLSQRLSMQDVTELQQLTFKDNRLDITQPQIYQKTADTIMGLLLSKQEIAQHANVLSFGPEAFIMKDASGYEFQVYYSKDFSLVDVSSKSTLLDRLEQQWYHQNRSYLTFTTLMMMLNILVVSNFLIIFVGAGLLWLARKQDFSAIKTFKESLTVLLNAAGLGTFLAFIIGWFLPDMTVMVTIQSAGFVLMLVMAFLTTQFSFSKTKKRSEVEVYE